MKCFNCGADLPDDTNFCSYCGKKMEKTVLPSGAVKGLQQLFESVTNEFKNVKPEKASAKKSAAGKNKKKDVRNKSDKNGKHTTAIMITCSFLCLAAFLVRKPVADDSKMHIDVSGAYQYGTFVWANDGLAGMLPIPKSTTGEIFKNDETGFLAYVANMSVDDFKSYAALCADKGFIVGANDTDKSYSAKNSEGYRLSVAYQGNDVICVTVDEPEYDVILAIECAANWFFNKYDVKVYVNDALQGTVKHGDSGTFSTLLTKGIYEVKFVSAEKNEVTGTSTIEVSKSDTFKYKISCASSEINVDTIAETAGGANGGDGETSAKNEEKSNAVEKTTAPEESVVNKPESNLTIDNCPDLANMLANKADIDASYSAFAVKYNGKTIEFDGSINYCEKHGDYKTRFDYLVGAGDYAPDSQVGPIFKFENVNYSDLHTDLDEVSVGLNVRIVAKVVSFNSNSGLFYLTPVSVTGRNGMQNNAAEKTTAPEDKKTSYHVTDMTAIMYAASTAEVRSGPDTDTSTLGTLSLSDEAAITGKVDNGWYQINYNGVDGFVKGDLLSTEKIIVQEAPLMANNANAGEEANVGSSGNVASLGNEGSSGNIGSSDNNSSSEVTVPSVGDTMENHVWIPTKTGTKYHSNPSCSNMSNPRQVTLEQAIALKRTPCKKCYN